ncbi:hypothetical protein MACJ_001840 [Theileria orientalis]|uniref:Bacterial surface antigen (D15) domain-containing protein n=1 Tax=Theileria orientalis TaxID=68886 RepID=A0A976QQW1_THEOR|nr:hypothetical protein MACJ_001840 [Theileria orientalis]
MADDDKQVYDLDGSKHLGNVRIFTKGLSKIKYSTVSKDVEKLKDSKNLSQLLSLLQDTHQKLDRLGIFKGLTSTIDRGEREGDVDVVLTFEEKPALYTAGASVNSKTKAGVEFKGEIPGIFGSSNTLTLSANTAGTGNNELTGSFYIPRIPLMDKFTGLFSVFTTFNDLKKYCSYTNRTKGFKFMLSNINQRHNFVWESSIRDVFPVFNDRMKASEMVLRNSGCSLKNSLSYVYKYDGTKADGVPTEGQITQIKLESGLPGGDSLFFKFNYNMLYSKQFFQKIIMNLNLGCGYLYNFGPYNKNSNLLDKFNFTGPSGSHLALRGFRFQGLGPFDHGLMLDDNDEWVEKIDHLGGDYYANLELSLYYPLKFIQTPKPMLFSFFNVGSLSNTTSRFDLYNQVFNDLRMSVGAGLSVNLARGCWLEAFYAKPLVYFPSDRISNFQLGLRFKHSM